MSTWIRGAATALLSALLSAPALAEDCVCGGNNRCVDRTASVHVRAGR